MCAMVGVGVLLLHPFCMVVGGKVKMLISLARPKATPASKT